MVPVVVVVVSSEPRCVCQREGERERERERAMFSRPALQHYVHTTTGKDRGETVDWPRRDCIFEAFDMRSTMESFASITLNPGT